MSRFRSFEDDKLLNLLLDLICVVFGLVIFAIAVVVFILLVGCAGIKPRLQHAPAASPSCFVADRFSKKCHAAVGGGYVCDGVHLRVLTTPECNAVNPAIIQVGR